MPGLPNRSDHEIWMKEALRQAEKALKAGEIPVGAVVVRDNKIIGRGYNQREQFKDPTAHAEIIAITAAAATIDDWRLTDCILYVTKEPCSMCAGAIVNARLSQVIFGCYDGEKGCCGSIYNFCNDPILGKPIPVRGGCLEPVCGAILREFFSSRRSDNR